MTCIDEYTLEKRLGQGAMGTVHLVTRKRDGRQLALKRVNFADLSHEERKQTLLEVALLSRLIPHRDENRRNARNLRK